MVSSMPDGNVTVCTIIHYPEYGIFKFLAKQKQLEELSLSCIKGWGSGPEIPTFTSRKLLVLNLDNFTINDASMFVGCVNLKTLTLTNVVLGDHNVILGEILRYCPNLENLAVEPLISSRGPWKECIIQSKKIKYLKIDNTDDMVTCYSDKFEKIVIKCPCLEELSLHHPGEWQIRQILIRPSGFLQDLGDEWSIKNLRVLCATLDLNTNKDIKLISHILHVWTNLETLDITSKVSDHSDTTEHTKVWGTKELSSKLRVVRIKRFRGTWPEIMFASLVIKKAAGLHQLEVECKYNCSKTRAVYAARLSSVRPRASNNVSIKMLPDSLV